MSDDEKKLIGKPFVKGVSGNPGGRTKGLERQVRKIVGKDIVAMTKAQVQIALGETPKDVEIKALTARDMTNAYNAVVDRGWGKARAVVDLTGDSDESRVQIDYEKLTEEELDKLIEAEEIALRAGLVEAPPSDEDDEDGEGESEPEAVSGDDTSTPS